jgi:hypothetical protein
MTVLTVINVGVSSDRSAINIYLKCDADTINDTGRRSRSNLQRIRLRSRYGNYIKKTFAECPVTGDDRVEVGDKLLFSNCIECIHNYLNPCCDDTNESLIY